MTNPDGYYWEGFCAFMDGMSFQQNPYPRWSEDHNLWANGWEDSEGAFRDAMTE